MSVVFSVVFLIISITCHVRWLQFSTRSRNTCRIKAHKWYGLAIEVFPLLNHAPPYQKYLLCSKSPCEKKNGQGALTQVRSSDLIYQKCYLKTARLFSISDLVRARVLKEQLPVLEVLSVSDPRNNTAPIPSLLQTPIHKTQGDNYSWPWFSGNLVGVILKHTLLP